MGNKTARTASALVQRGPWLTNHGCATVLCVIHTTTYATRMRDIYCLLESDLRVQVVFTVAPHAFGQGVHQYLHRAGITVIPWEEAIRTPFDLAIAAGSEGIDQLRAPVIRVPHGAGHSKLLRPGHRTAPDSGEEDTEQVMRAPVMLSRSSLTRGGQLIPAAVALAHHDDLAELERWCPQALPVATVVGDPVYDRMVASRPHRAAYRHALGLSDEQRLVVVLSTWGADSLFGNMAAVLPPLARELPANYRLVLATHPNIGAGHGSWQLRGWLRPMSREGVTILMSGEPLEPYLTASDWVIGDHGSMTVYGALSDATVLTAQGPVRSISPASPAALLARRVPALSLLRPPLEQLHHAKREFRPGSCRLATDRLTSEPGRFAELTRALIYRLLGLSEPAFPAQLPLAAPPAPLQPQATERPMVVAGDGRLLDDAGTPPSERGGEAG